MAFKIERLLKCVLDAGEGRAQFVAETAHARDDCNRDAGGNQAIFYGGCARLIFEETHQLRNPRAPSLSEYTVPVLCCRCGPLHIASLHVHSEKDVLWISQFVVIA